MFRHACAWASKGSCRSASTAATGQGGARAWVKVRIQSTSGGKDRNGAGGCNEGPRSHCPASALRVAGLLDEWGEELVGTLERQAARGQGPTERQRFAAIALLKRFDPEIVAGALADHIARLTPEKVERIHRDARGREKDST